VVEFCSPPPVKNTIHEIDNVPPNESSDITKCCLKSKSECTQKVLELLNKERRFSGNIFGERRFSGAIYFPNEILEIIFNFLDLKGIMSVSEAFSDQRTNDMVNEIVLKKLKNLISIPCVIQSYTEYFNSFFKDHFVREQNNFFLRKKSLSGGIAKDCDKKSSSCFGTSCFYRGSLDEEDVELHDDFALRITLRGFELEEDIYDIPRPSFTVVEKDLKFEEILFKDLRNKLIKSGLSAFITAITSIIKNKLKNIFYDKTVFEELVKKDQLDKHFYCGIGLAFCDNGQVVAECWPSIDSLCMASLKPSCDFLVKPILYASYDENDQKPLIYYSIPIDIIGDNIPKAPRSLSLKTPGLNWL